MKKIRLTATAVAAFLGIASAIAANARFNSKEVRHDWMDWTNETVIANATQEEAQYLCTSSAAICLRARDNVLLHTTGELPWLSQAKTSRRPVTGNQDFATKQGSR